MIVPAVLSQARRKAIMHNVARFFETMQNSRVAFIGTGVTNGDIIRLFRKKLLFGTQDGGIERQ